MCFVYIKYVKVLFFYIVLIELDIVFHGSKFRAPVGFISNNMYVYTYMIYKYHQKVSLPCHSNPNNIKMKHYALNGTQVLMPEYLQFLKAYIRSLNIENCYFYYY